MRGTLVPGLEGWQTPEISLYAVYLSRKQLSAKVRVFIDYLVESIGPEPYWEAWDTGRKSGAAAQPRRRTVATRRR